MLTLGSKVRLRVLKIFRPKTWLPRARSWVLGWSSSISEVFSFISSRRRDSLMSVPVALEALTLFCCSYSCFTRVACSLVTPLRASSEASCFCSLPWRMPSFTYSRTWESLMLWAIKGEKTPSNRMNRNTLNFLRVVIGDFCGFYITDWHIYTSTAKHI